MSTHMNWDLRFKKRIGMMTDTESHEIADKISNMESIYELFSCDVFENQDGIIEGTSSFVTYSNYALENVRKEVSDISAEYPDIGFQLDCDIEGVEWSRTNFANGACEILRGTIAYECPTTIFY